MEHQLVIFKLAQEHYGVDIAAVESIIKMQPITPVPRAPAFVEGVTNLRGSVLPVMDLRKRLGLVPISAASSERRVLPSFPPEVEGHPPDIGESNRGYGKDARIVVVSLDGVKVGMIVDAVTEVLRVADEAIEPPPPMVSTVDTAFITAIAKVGTSSGSSTLDGNGGDAWGQATRLVILLDLGRVLSLDEKAELQGAKSELQGAG